MSDGENDEELSELAAILAAESPDAKYRNLGLYANNHNYDEETFQKYCDLGETKLTERQLLALWEPEEVDTPPLTLAEQIELAESYDFELDVTHGNICHGIEISYPRRIFYKDTMADLTIEQKRKIRNTMLLDAYRFYEKYVLGSEDERKAHRDREFNKMFAPWFEVRFMRNRYERIKKIGEEDIAAGNAVYATSSDSEREVSIGNTSHDEHVDGYDSQNSVVTVITSQASQSSDGTPKRRLTRSRTNLTPLRAVPEEIVKQPNETSPRRSFRLSHGNVEQISPVANATSKRPNTGGSRLTRSQRSSQASTSPARSTRLSQASPAKQPSPAKRVAPTNRPSPQKQQSPTKRYSQASHESPVAKRTRHGKNSKMDSDQNSVYSSFGPALENVIPETDTEGGYSLPPDNFADANRAQEYVDEYEILLRYSQEEVDYIRDNDGDADVPIINDQTDDIEPDTDTESFHGNLNKSGTRTSTQK